MIIVSLTLTALFSGCQAVPKESRPESARRELMQRGLQYSEENFIGRAKAGDAQAVKLFLAAGMHPDVKDKDGWTPLMQAALNVHRDTVNTLLDAGADVNAKNHLGYTALMCVSLKGDVPIVKSLLAKGADVEAMDNTGFTALMYADARGHVHVIEVLLHAGARVTHGRLHSMPPEKKF